MLYNFMHDTWGDWKDYYNKSGKLGKTEAITVGVLVGSVLLSLFIPAFGIISAFALVFLGVLFCVGVMKGVERLFRAANSGLSLLEHKTPISPQRQCPHCDSTISVKAHICPFCRLEIQ